MRIVAVADLHGWLPAEVPACDLLIIAGDICPDGDRQFQWLDAELRPWLEAVPARYVVATWGNHDYAAEWGYVPPLPCAFLVDEGIDIEGVAVYGTPWTREAGMWAFSEPEAVLAGTFARIPDGVDIVISHSPPLGWCDRTPEGTYRGSAALLDAMERARPRLTICGHAHDGRGGADAPWGRIENVSAVDGRRRRRRSPFVVIDWPGATAGETRAATSDGIDGSWPGTAVAS